MSEAQQQELKDLGWCIVELMGHRRLGAIVKEESIFGVVMCRCEIPVPVPDGEPVTPRRKRSPEAWRIGSAEVHDAVLRRISALRLAAPPVSRFELPPAPQAQAPAMDAADFEAALLKISDPETGEEDLHAATDALRVAIGLIPPRRPDLDDDDDDPPYDDGEPDFTADPLDEEF